MTYKVATRFCTKCGRSIEGFIGWIIYDTGTKEDKSIGTKYRHSTCPPAGPTPLTSALPSPCFSPKGQRRTIMPSTKQLVSL